MKILSAYFKGLAGVYRASGKKEIFIDFSKCISDIILIIGPNGSGKTTILDSLTPLPDPVTNFMQGVEGIEEICYIDGDIIYRVKIIYPLKMDFTRATTKGFITKISPDGTEEEYNTNGNITSFKDKVYELFGLDPNFISLTKLSMDDRGIVSKTPSERKKFVTNILESVEVYNDIYKVLCKRSSVFKSLINSVAAKINSIGDEESLNSRYNFISTRIKFLSKERDKIIKAISDNEAMIKVADPDGQIQSKYNNLVIELRKYENIVNQLMIITTNCQYNSAEECADYINKLDNTINQINSNIIKLRSSNEQMISIMNKEYENLIAKQSKLASLQSDDNVKLLKEKIDQLKRDNEGLLNGIPEAIISNYSGIYIDIFTSGLKLVDNIIEDINRIKEQGYENDILEALEYIKTGENITNDINKYKSIVNVREVKIKELQQSRSVYERDLELTQVLSKRPSTCKDDNCQFIKRALDALSNEPEKNIERINEEIYELQTDMTIASDEEYRLEYDVLPIYNNIMIILRNISSNVDILNKIGATFITDRNKFLDIIPTNNINVERNKLYDILQYINYMEIYKNNTNELEKLENRLSIYNDRISLIEELTDSVLQLDREVKLYEKTIDENQNKIDDLSQRYIELLHEKETMETYKSKFDTLKEVNSKISETKSKINIISNDIKSIEICINNINNLNNELLKINNDLDPLSSEKDSISYSLNVLKSYKMEIDELNLKYDKIETVKKYSSPNRGIQTLYMELYMGKTLKIANELLGMMFNGNLVLLDYIINENEFRIPCKSANSDIINDDIRSCSSAERSMIGMIISLALSTQSSSKCNIVRLDEVDSPLDEDNRQAFIPTMSRIMDIMHIEQTIMISHNSESELSNVDIICLNKQYSGPGNIIFQY